MDKTEVGLKLIVSITLLTCGMILKQRFKGKRIDLAYS